MDLSKIFRRIKLVLANMARARASEIDSLIERAQSIARKMADEANLQTEEYQQKHSSTYRRGRDTFGNTYLGVDGQFLPESQALAKFTADHDYFLFFLTDTFWKLHTLVSSSLGDPLVQFSMRPLIELCYGKIMYFALQDDAKKKDITVKYFLCSNGMLLGNPTADRTHTAEIHEHLINELRREDDRNRFRNIRQAGHKLDDYAEEMQRIFPSVRIEHTSQQIEPYLKAIWGASYKKEYVGMLYSWMSQFMHGNMYLLRHLQKEQEDKSHAFKSILVLFVTGYHLLDFTHHKVLGHTDDTRLHSLKEEINRLVKDFVDFRNANRIGGKLRL